MRNLNWQRIGLHILFWLTYVPLNAVLNCVINRLPVEEAFPQALMGEAFSLPVKIPLTYFVFYYIIPLYFDRKQVWKMVGMTLAGFLVSAFAYRLILGYVIFPIAGIKQKLELLYWPGIFVTLFDLFITVAAAIIIKLIRLNYASREFEAQLIREKLQSELNFLRAQTNPHFLFNTLNNLYVLAWKKSDRTADAIMMLSKIMRFVLYDCRAPRILVADEAKVIEDYIELEKLRYTNRLTIKYNKEIDDPSTAIAPLMLLPFVENSFKHGANSTAGDAEIHIDLQLRDKTLIFSVENTVEEKEADDKTANSDGIGLKNVKRQLDLIYSGKYTLDIEPGSQLFKVNLTINLSEN